MNNEQIIEKRKKQREECAAFIAIFKDTAIKAELYLQENPNAYLNGILQGLRGTAIGIDIRKEVRAITMDKVKNRKPTPKPVQKKPEKKQPPVASPEAADDLEGLNVAQLRKLAKEKGVKGYHRMKKTQLLDAIA